MGEKRQYETNILLRKSGSKWEDNIKADLRKSIWNGLFDSLADICERDYEPAGNSRLRVVQRHIHFHIFILGVVLNYLSIVTTESF
jgi:hypothetical protein